MTTASWINQGEYPFEPHWFAVGTKRLHYVDEGQGKPVVFIHGSPVWSFTFRHLIKALRHNYRCIAPDAIGFGLSDKPENWTYRPERQAEYIMDFIESLGLSEITLVAHGTGGPAALAYAVERPDKVSHLVLMNTFMWPLADYEPAKRIDGMVNGPLGRMMFLNMNWPVRALKRAIVDKKHFTKEICEQFAHPFAEVAHRHGPYGCAQSLTASTRFYQTLWDRRQAISRIPAQLLWGMKDPLFGEAALRKMEVVFDDPQVKRFNNSGHYLTEELGPGIVPYVEMFVSDSAYLPTATLM